jgi:hypothetical protein
MRQRQDFYTLCPSCETSVELTLAAKLQAARAGCSCACHSCQHEWVCIQEWIYRHESIDLSQPIVTAQPIAPVQQPAQVPQQVGGYQHTPPATVAAIQPPRPHLPTFQPPQPIAQPAQQQPVQQQPATLAVDVPVASDQQNVAQVPAPHAWSWERKAQEQPSPSRDSQSGFGQ